MYKLYYKNINSIIENKNLESIIKYNDPQMKIISLKGWSFLEDILLKEYNIIFDVNDIYFNEYKKPYLLNQNLFFNISHSKDMIAIVISDMECGVDIEYIDYNRDVDKLKNKVLSKKELNTYIIRKEKIKYFYSIWTKKEAYFKKKGKGIELNMLNKDIPLEGIVTKIINNDNNKYSISICI